MNGWLSVAIFIGTQIAAAVSLVRLAARRWWISAGRDLVRWQRKQGADYLCKCCKHDPASANRVGVRGLFSKTSLARPWRRQARRGL